MARSIRPFLVLLCLAGTLVVCQASDPVVKKEIASSPTSPPAVESAQTADVVSKPAHHCRLDCGDRRGGEIILANLANAETDGYKRQIVSFTTVLAGPSRADGSRPKQDLLPSSYHVGMALAPPVMDMSPGKIRQTGRPLDLAIAGEGLFCVMPADNELRATIYYTRCGRFTLNEAGGIVLHGLNRDWVLTPPLTIPERASNVEIMTDGRVRVTVTGKSKDDKPREDQLYVGVITLFSLPPDCEFTPCGDNVLWRT